METKKLNKFLGIRPAAPCWRPVAMAALALAALALLASMPAAAAAAAGGAATVPPLFGGVHVNEPDHDAWAASVRAAGLDSVQVSLYARQGAWDAPELSWEADHPWVVAEIRAARRAGLRTVLVLRVALDHGAGANRHLWHGMIWPRHEAVDAWFDRYRAFALQGATLAAAEGVDLLAIGNELSALTSTTPASATPDLYAYFMDAERVGAVNAALGRCAEAVQGAGGGADLRHLDGGRYPTLAAMLAGEASRRDAWARTVVGAHPHGVDALNARRRRHEAAWRGLIADVRAVYGGAVTYGANFDQYAEVGFWDALDAVAVNAYFPLGLYGMQGPERLQRMRRSWEAVASSLEATAAGRPIVFLELGWTRRSGTTVRPYSYDRVEVLETAPGGDHLSCVHWASQPEDPQERVDAIRALAATVRAGGFPSLRGVQLWKLSTRPEHRAIEPFAIGLGLAADAADARLVSGTAAIAVHVSGAGRGQETDGELELGQEIFLSECASCHGNRGKGDGPAARFYDPPPRDLTSGDWRYARGGTAEEIARVVAEGVSGTDMEPFEGILTGDEIAAVARWVAERIAVAEGGAP